VEDSELAAHDADGAAHALTELAAELNHTVSRFHI
jgi:hypothetical protein